MSISSQLAASRLIQPGVIPNTASRPASPFQGQCIYQTDTNQLLVWNGTAWVIPNQRTQNPEGLELITTATVAGQPNFTVDGCFTSTYDRYRLMVDMYGSGGTFANLRLRASGVDSPSTGYFKTGHYTIYSSSAVNGYNGSNEAGVIPVVQYGGLSNTSAGVVEVNFPASASINTSFFATTIDPAAIQQYTIAVVHNSVAAYDGFKIYASAGTITGNVQVYGYRRVI
jgi:hypothetical protein